MFLNLNQSSDRYRLRKLWVPSLPPPQYQSSASTLHTRIVTSERHAKLLWQRLNGITQRREGLIGKRRRRRRRKAYSEGFFDRYSVASLIPPLDRPYTSIDPAPPTSGLLANKPAPVAISTESISDLRAKLLDTKLPLFERYRAMFALRNIGTEEAVDALAVGFTDDSALFK